MKAKRFFSVLLVVMMLVSCFAISASANDAVYDATQPLTLNIHLYKGVADTAEAGTTDATGKASEEATKVSDKTPIPNATFEVKNAAGTVVATIKTDSDGLATVTNASGTSTVNKVYTDDLVRGRYTVHQKTPLGDNQSIALADFNVDLPLTNPTDNGFLYTVDVYPKVPVFEDTPTITKKVSDEASDYGHDASIHSIKGNLAYWQITVDLPENIKNYKELVVVDILDTRLINPDNLAVAHSGDTAFVPADYEGSFNNGKLVLKIKDSGIAKLVDNGTITITYTTEIDLNATNAVGNVIGNHVVLKYTDAGNNTDFTDNTPDNEDDDFGPEDSNTTNDPTKDEFDSEDWPNNPGDNTTGKEDKDPYVWTGAINGLKTDNDTTPAALSGAEFTLYSDAACTTPVEVKSPATNPAVSGTDGKFSFTGLKAGKYYLVETKAPKHYELDGTVRTIEIVSPLTNAADKSSTKDTIVNVTVKNIPSTDLPLTGGMGVGMFAVLGLALAAFGGVYLFKSRKADASC